MAYQYVRNLGSVGIAERLINGKQTEQSEALNVVVQK